MSKECKCEAVQPMGDGTWRCIRGECRSSFVPASELGKAVLALSIAVGFISYENMEEYKLAAEGKAQNV
jgi:hypothetical protein